MQPHPSAPETIAIAALAPQPWKNGAGLTREIALQRDAAASGHGVIDFDWRVSLAEIANDAPFSAYPGIDRCITLLHGAGMRLASSDTALDHDLCVRLQPFHFAGELALQAHLHGGACHDFNVMTRRGAWRAEVVAIRGSSELADADATLLLAVDGTWTIEAGATDHDAAWTLRADHALLWRRPRGTLWATTPAAPHEAALLLVRLCQHRR
ncbi:MAG TPA: HutD family protein [Burkholderiaceae bacterium]